MLVLFGDAELDEGILDAELEPSQLRELPK